LYGAQCVRATKIFFKKEADALAAWKSLRLYKWHLHYIFSRWHIGVIREWPSGPAAIFRSEAAAREGWRDRGIRGSALGPTSKTVAFSGVCATGRKGSRFCGIMGG